MKKVCVMGLEDGGLVTGVLAAQSGFEVVGIDHDEKRVIQINSGIFPHETTDTLDALAGVIKNGRFRASTKCEPAHYFVIASSVCTRHLKSHCLSYISTAAHSLIPVLKKGDTIIVASTIPVGTTNSLIDVISHETGFEVGKDFFAAYCPERVVPGHLFQDIRVHDRVIGGAEKNSARRAADFYKYFVSGDLYLTDIKTAELTKLVEDSYQDVMSAFSHQITTLARQEGINPYELIELANKHPRVSIMTPACGIGKHCMITNPWFLISSFPRGTELLRTARSITDEIPLEIQKEIEKEIVECKIKKDQCTVLLLGISSGPDCAEASHSLARTLVYNLSKSNKAEFIVYDPYIENDGEYAFNFVDAYEGLDRADIVVALVPHKEFAEFDQSLLEKKRVLDFCGLFYKVHAVSREQEQYFWPASSVNQFDGCETVIEVAKSQEEKQ